MRRIAKLLLVSGFSVAVVAIVIPFLPFPEADRFLKYSAPAAGVISVLLLFIGFWLSVRTESIVTSILEQLGLITGSANYLELAHKFYAAAQEDEVIYTCTSTWPVLPEKRNVLLNLRARDIVFLGPIDVGPRFPGVLWKVRMYLDRVAKGKQGYFQIWHREERSLKFITAGQTVLLSRAQHDEASNSGFLFENSPSHASLYRSAFRQLLMKDSIPLEARLLSLAQGIIDRQMSITDFCNRMCVGASDHFGFTRRDWVRTMEDFIRSSPRLSEAMGLRWDAREACYYIQKPDDFITKIEVRKGRSLSGQRALPVGVPALRLVVTPECSLECVYCPRCNENYSRTGKLIPPDRFSSIVDAALVVGFENIRITGGEPLGLGQSLLKLIKELHDTNSVKSIRLATNGLALKKFVPDLRQFGRLSLKVSLDTLDPSMYQQLCGVEGLNNVMEGIAEARNAGLCIAINTVVTRDNVGQVPKLVDYCKKHRMDMKLLDLNCYSDLPRGYWKDNYVPLVWLTNQLAKKYGNWRMVNTVGNYGIPMSEIETDEGTWIKIKDSSLGSHYSPYCVECKYFPCQEGLFQFTVTSDGKVKACRHRPDMAVKLPVGGKDPRKDDIAWVIRQTVEKYYRGAFYAPNPPMVVAKPRGYPER